MDGQRGIRASRSLPRLPPFFFLFCFRSKAKRAFAPLLPFRYRIMRKCLCRMIEQKFIPAIHPLFFSSRLRTKNEGETVGEKREGYAVATKHT